MYTLMDRPITNVTPKENYHYHVAVGSWKKILYGLHSKRNVGRLCEMRMPLPSLVFLWQLVSYNFNSPVMQVYAPEPSSFILGYEGNRPMTLIRIIIIPYQCNPEIWPLLFNF